MAAVRERIASEWAALQDVIGRLSEVQLTRPGRDGGWSIKDHIAHISGWEEYLLGVLAHDPAHTAFGLDAATFETLDTDGLNARLHERSRDRPLEEVLVTSKRTHRRVLESLATISDDHLGKTIAALAGDPSDDRTLLWKIAANTYEHYTEHRGWILEQLSASPSGRGKSR